MKEEKKTFSEKWQNKKYQAKVKLSGYGIFVGVVILLLVFGGSSSGEYHENNSDLGNKTPENNNIDNNLGDNNITFDKPDVKNYSYEIEIIIKQNNEELKYYYFGKVLDAYEELEKKVEKKEYNYRIKDGKYYVFSNEKYILTTQEEVYDILDYNYLNIDNINNYLSYSELVDNSYQVYLKDIILDNDSGEYITITLNDSKASIDYTNLINTLEDKEYDSCIVKIKYMDN